MSALVLFISAATGVALVVMSVVVAVVGLGVYSDVVQRTYADRWYTQSKLLLYVLLMASIGVTGVVVMGMAIAAMVAAYAPAVARIMRRSIWVCAAVAGMFYVYAFVSSMLEHVVSRSPFEARRMIETMRLNGVIVGVVVAIVGLSMMTYLARAVHESGVPSAENWIAAIAAKSAVSMVVYLIAIALRHSDSLTGESKQKEIFWIETKMWLAFSLGVGLSWAMIVWNRAS